MLNRSLLDDTLHISPYQEKTKNYVSNWGKKQRRGFHRCFSGIKKAIYNGERLRLLTLTNKNWNERLNKDFQALKQRIRRKGYRFEYWKCRTSEGGGVLHIVYRGDFIPQAYLSEMWYQITGDSFVVDIREIDYSSGRRVASYVVSQHLSGGQGDNVYVRSSWSWNWVYRRFVKDWYRIIKMYADSRGIKYCVSLWDFWLLNGIHPTDDSDLYHKTFLSAPHKLNGSWCDNRFWWCGQDE